MTGRPAGLDPDAVRTYALREAEAATDELIDALVEAADVELSSTCNRCGKPILWDDDARDWRADDGSTDGELVCDAGIDTDTGEQLGSIDHEPQPGIAVPIGDPVVLVMDRAHAVALRTVARATRAKREKRLARSTYVPAPGHKHMDAVVAALWADIEGALAALSSGETDAAAVAYRPGGTLHETTTEDQR